MNTTDRSEEFTRSGGRLVTDPVQASEALHSIFNDTRRKFRAEVDVEIEAESLAEAERLVADAVADLADRNPLDATVASVTEHRERTIEDALREWSGGA